MRIIILIVALIKATFSGTPIDNINHLSAAASGIHVFQEGTRTAATTARTIPRGDKKVLSSFVSRCPLAPRLFWLTSRFPVGSLSLYTLSLPVLQICLRVGCVSNDLMIEGVLILFWVDFSWEFWLYSFWYRGF